MKYYRLLYGASVEKKKRKEGLHKQLIDEEFQEHILVISDHFSLAFFGDLWKEMPIKLLVSLGSRIKMFMICLKDFNTLRAPYKR